MTTSTPEPQAKPVPLGQQKFHLVASRRGLIKTFGKFEEHEGRLNDLPEQPENFRPVIGTYPDVAAAACHRNNVQIDHGFLDYLYAVERLDAKPIPKGPTT